MLAILLATIAISAPSSPLGDTLADPFAPTPSVPAASEHLDTVIVLRHGALEDAKVLTAGDSLAFQVLEWLRDHVLHSRTSDATIRKRLILKPGDRPDSLRLKEAGRLLRLERFLADARVDTLRLDDGRLALRAESWDRWSSATPFSMGRSGGEFNWFLGIREANLLGTGQDLSIVYSSTELQRGWTFDYANTAVFAPGGQIQASYVDLNDGHDLAFTVGYPNRSRYQRWAWTLEGRDRVYQRRILATPSVRERFTREYGATWSNDALFAVQPDSRFRWTRASLIRYWGESTRLGISLVAESELDSVASAKGAFTVDSAKLDATRQDPYYLAWRAPQPHRDDRRLGLALSVRGIDHVRLNNFNNLKWTEDIPLGWQLAMSAYANVLSSGDVRDDGLAQASASWTGIAWNVYHTAATTWKSFFEGADARKGTSTTRLEARWIPSSRFQTILSVSNDAIYGVPVYRSQLSLGEDNGLPGYPARAFTGRGRFLSGAELRWTPPLEALTVAPALAVFGGTGRVSNEATWSDRGDWKTGMGVGLRFGMTRSISGVVNHLSISRPIGDGERKSWLVSFGAKQSL
ncbi:MAG TPA: hypothetical protein PK208_07475 [Fibrobacteria bacterium]|nr:hypothetical protein [Fibrobacteria bacterium]